MMRTSVYLEDHPPARTQHRARRRATPTGAIVVHTAENSTDLALPDAGAENVAHFISTRTDAPGSYHTIVDSDTIVDVGRFDWEMFHEGTGGNSWSLGLAFACRADQWDSLPDSWTGPALHNGAMAAAIMAAWIRVTVGVAVPAQRITPAQYRAGAPGFIGHGDLDPGRRTDPGRFFPWARFLALYSNQIGQEPMTNPYAPETNEGLDILREHAGYRGKRDGYFGPLALAALHHLKNERVQLGAMIDDLLARDDVDEIDAKAYRALIPHLEALTRDTADLSNTVESITAIANPT